MNIIIKQPFNKIKTAAAIRRLTRLSVKQALDVVFPYVIYDQFNNDLLAFEGIAEYELQESPEERRYRENEELHLKSKEEYALLVKEANEWADSLSDKERLYLRALTSFYGPTA